MVAGRVTEFVRAGDEVLRPPTGSSESVKHLLMHLEKYGFEGAPRVKRHLGRPSVVGLCPRPLAVRPCVR